MTIKELFDSKGNKLTFTYAGSSLEIVDKSGEVITEEFFPDPVIRDFGPSYSKPYCDIETDRSFTLDDGITTLKATEEFIGIDPAAPGHDATIFFVHCPLCGKNARLTKVVDFKVFLCPHCCKESEVKWTVPDTK